VESAYQTLLGYSATGRAETRFRKELLSKQKEERSTGLGARRGAIRRLKNRRRRGLAEASLSN
jgi:hypothetical protein